MSASTTSPYLFSFPYGKLPQTTRGEHIRRLYDVIMLSIGSGKLDRARKAYAILVRCREVKWAKLWRLGMFLLSESNEERRDVEYLRAMLLQHPEEVRQLNPWC